MGFRFWRRLQVAPGLRVNLSRSGASLSVGPRGAAATVGPGGARGTVGLPGTGLFYTVQAGGGRRGGRGGGEAGDGGDAPPASGGRGAPPELGLLERLTASSARRAFVRGLRALHGGDDAEGLRELRRAADALDAPNAGAQGVDDAAVDAAWLAGLLTAKRGELDAAVHLLERAAAHGDRLGVASGEEGVDLVVRMPLSEVAVAHLHPHPAATTLALAEVEQERDRLHVARAHLERLRADAPNDPLVLAAWSDVVLAQVEAAEAAGEEGDTDDLHAVHQATLDVENESALHAAVVLARGRALRRLGLPTAARDAFTAAYRRKKDRPEALLRAARYERALCYEALGRKARARAEFEAIYAGAPTYEDVADRLGLAG
jgi:tetratricopeptide (TPR) repeat protein